MKKLLTACFFALSFTAAAQDNHSPNVIIETTDADRFASLFYESKKQPTVSDLKEHYFKNAGAGLDLLAKTRIRDAQHLAEEIASNPEKYERAINVCLPLAKSAQDDLEVIYNRLSRSLPEYSLPEVHVVFGAGTAAGTAAPGVQVLGLEAICAAKNTNLEIMETFRFFFAHETIHTFQGMPDPQVYAEDPLLVASIYEGLADYIAHLVTGRVPDEARDEWAHANIDNIWKKYAADRKTLRLSAQRGETLATLSPQARAALKRWHFNAGNAPEGWPSEAGYWVGRQIVANYVQHSVDRDKAIRELLSLQSPLQILQTSGLSDRLTLTNSPDGGNDD